MKLLAITLACIVALASACEEKTREELTQLKCSSDIVFRGALTSGQSSVVNMDPDTYFTFRRDTFRVIEDFKGNVAGTSQMVISMIPHPSPCPSNNGAFGANEALVFANLNTQFHTYEVQSCSYQPAFSCVNEEAFRDIVC